MLLVLLSGSLSCGWRCEKLPSALLQAVAARGNTPLKDKVRSNGIEGSVARIILCVPMTAPAIDLRLTFQAGEYCPMCAFRSRSFSFCHLHYLNLQHCRPPHLSLEMATNIRAFTARQAPFPLGQQLVDDVPKSQVSSLHINYLSLRPRPVHSSFENDGPGYLSKNGPRHDNDHVSIRDIQILPTTDEILAVHRSPWMPKKNIAEPHFLAPGPLRLLDTLFRHLRYDSTESIRDVCFSAAQSLALPQHQCGPDLQARQDTPSENRYFMYQNARIEELLAHEYKGMLIRVSYDCPRNMQGRQMHSSGRFEKGMLCALVGLDEDHESLSTTFFSVHLSQSTYSMQRATGNDMRAAVQLAFPKSATQEDILRNVRYAQGIDVAQFVLVEFPKLLYEGFYPCLKRLQEMGGDDIAFSSYIAPRVTRDFIAAVLPPAYSQRPGFQYNLSCLAEDPATGKSSLF
jgi:hypothetical protein